MNYDEINFNYSVPESWYDGLYKDQVEPIKGARSFCLLHETKSKDCWLLIQGYRGYPGELVRPAYDLYEIGFDVYVPRFPGSGTSTQDFIRSHEKDWVGLAQNALNDLKTKYKKVHLLGHSMGSAIVALIGTNDPQVGKIIYACPGFTSSELTPEVILRLKLIAPFKATSLCGYKKTNRHHLHFKTAYEDDLYLGEQYWKYHFHRQLLDFVSVTSKGLEAFKKYPHDHLIICPLNDLNISVASLALLNKANNNQNRVVEIENGTHLVFYDIDPKAEEAAVKAVIDYAKE